MLGLKAKRRKVQYKEFFSTDDGKEILADFEWLENKLDNSNNFLLDNQFVPEYNIGVEEDDA